MSFEYRAILLEEERIDSLWQKLASAHEDSQLEIITSVLKGSSAEREIDPIIAQFGELQASWLELNKEKVMMQIAELDQEFLIDLATIKHIPEYGRGFMGSISRFAQAIGIHEIDPDGGGEDRVLTEQWIKGFQSFTKEKQDTIKEELGGEHGSAWREFAWEIASLRNIVRFCQENSKKMLVFLVGDAILVPYFAKRAEKIYRLLQSSWVKN